MPFVEDAASVAMIVNAKVPAVVGVPARFPLLASVNPGGNVPVEVKVYGPPIPPVAVKVWPYATLTVPPGTENGPTTTGGTGAMTIEYGEVVEAPS